MVVVVLRESRNGCTGAKLNVEFNAMFQPLNKLGRSFKGQLGQIVRNPHRVPLTYLSWGSVPEDIVEGIWKEVQKIASRNSKNRELRGPVHRTGRTPFADVRHKMMTDGESTNKMSVFMKTRMITDPDVKLFLDEYNEQLSMIDEPLRTEEVQDKIFHNLVGKDGHGYCKTYGIGVPRSAVYKKDVSPSQASSSSTVEEITQQVRQTVTEEIEQRLTVEIEQRVTEKLKAEFEQVRAWMDFIRSQGGLSGIQVPNASSGRQQVRKSVGDHDSQDDELLGSPVQFATSLVRTSLHVLQSMTMALILKASYCVLNIESLIEQFRKRPKCFFILTNSRALSSDKATVLVEDICRNLCTASKSVEKTDFTIVLRGDSTLRGQYVINTSNFVLVFVFRFCMKTDR
ncbi:hypothetical protein TEA_009972 [Camellia sinensis var. sinensis]|uniref:Four-carbon acid sugar kinase N-terminal domain-containing protein n=1 Tax=Camellia sinensis var. sinensis TaxID=542762 RepID=A0A4S4EFK9_CAMSN|nr:hypothetical protein TEA_009972 [Camellia sinensis var. sinensis]